MPLFRYEVRDRTGKPVFGVMQSTTEFDVRQALAAKNFTVQSITQVGDTGGTAAANRSSSTPAATVPVARPQQTSWTSTSTKELAILFRQLSQLQHAGVSIYQALERIGTETRNSGMRKIALRMASRVQNGEQLSDCMAEFPRAFAPHIVGCVAAAEVAGLMPLVLGDIALDYEIALRASNRIGKMISWALWVNAFIMILLAPFASMTIKEGFKAIDSGKIGEHTPKLEVVGQVFSPILHYIMTKLFIPMVLIVGVYHLVMLILRQPSMTRLRHQLVLKVPWASKVSRERSLASFSRILWRLQNAGILPIRAWDVASRVPENTIIGASLQAQTPLISSGAKFSDALKATNLFTYDDLRVLQTAEMSGQTIDTLQSISTQYEDSAMTSAGKARWIGLRIAVIATLIGTGVFLCWSATYLHAAFEVTDKWINGL